MARKTKGKRKSLKSKRDATLKKTRLNFQLVSAELIEAEIILDDCIYEFNERFETGRRPQIVEPEEYEESDSTDMVPSEAEFEEEEEIEEEEEEQEREEVDEVEDEFLERDRDLKDLFKKIALKTHPDRLGDDDNVEHKTELYKEAAAAVRSGDGMALLEIAYELDIQVDIDPVKEIEWLNKKIRMTQHKVNEMKNTAEWIWYHSDGAERVRVELMVQGQLGFKIRESNQDDKSDE
jgi:hypothetical protein